MKESDKILTLLGANILMGKTNKQEMKEDGNFRESAMKAVNQIGQHDRITGLASGVGQGQGEGMEGSPGGILIENHGER